MPCFGVTGGKKFAYVSNDHHGDGKVALLVKIGGAEEQALLIERDGERYYRPAYFGDGWIGIRLDLGDTDWDEVADRLKWSWRVSAPKRLISVMRPASSSGLSRSSRRSRSSVARLGPHLMPIGFLMPAKYST